MKSPSPTIDLLAVIDQGYARSAWHGPNLKQALRGVSAESAAWRPAPGRHNIWELALHCAYWKFAVRRRLMRLKDASFPLPGSNWFERPGELSEKAWKRDKNLLEGESRKLREAFAEYLSSQIPKDAQLRMISGAAFHDVYHAGQIRLLRKLQEAKS